MNVQRPKESDQFPSGWRHATLQQILPIKYGKARSAAFGRPCPHTPVFGSNGAYGTFERALTKGAAIIIGRKGAAGAVHYSPIPCWPIDTAFYTEGSEHAHLPFFRYLLEHLQLIRLDRSTAIPSLSRDDYDTRIVHFPEAIEAQQCIVAEIEKHLTRVDSGVAALRRVQANLKRYRAAVLKAACEGRTVTWEDEVVPRTNHRVSGESGEELLARIRVLRRQQGHRLRKYRDPAEPDTENVPTLPDGWVWASLAELSYTSAYGTSAKCSYSDSGPPVLRIPNIASGRIDLADLKFAEATLAIAAGEQLLPGDLLIIRTNGSKRLIGRSAVVRDELHRAISYASYLIRFRLIALPELIYWISTIWDVSFLREWIERRAATSAGQHNISMSVLSSMPIPLPPLVEQARIVAEVERRLSIVAELETTVAANLDRAARLRQSILQKAFTGNLVARESEIHVPAQKQHVTVGT